MFEHMEARWGGAVISWVVDGMSGPGYPITPASLLAALLFLAYITLVPWAITKLIK